MKLKQFTINNIYIGEVAICDSFFLRLRGLIGRDFNRDGFEALALIPCKQIHTMFMKSAIDVIYLNKDYTIIELERYAKPYRFFPFVKNAYITVELPAGFIDLVGINAGDICHFD